MFNTTTESGETPGGRLEPEALCRVLKARYEAAGAVRRGVCLLNAGRYEQASASFREAMDRGCPDKSLPSYLAACLLAEGKPEAAAERFAKVADQDRSQSAARIRSVLALWSAGHSEAAVASLRDAIEADPECAEYHFQLGTLLTSLEQYDEAELRFAQALSIDHDHSEALLSMGLCCGLRGALTEAAKHLQRAQALRPHDARIGMLLAQAGEALMQQGQAVHIRAYMPGEESIEDRGGIDELSRAIEAELDFVDSFLSIPSDMVDERVFVVLAKALEAAIARRPDHAGLHFQDGRVAKRLGRRDDAIRASEQAVQIDPTFTRALIELGRLYAQTDRWADATTRLEQAVEAGGAYADVYLLLGSLYRNRGLVTKARSAYRRALVINESYEAALEALADLPA